MRNSLIFLSLFGSFIIFSMTINLFEVALLFVLFGIVPNSDIVISANRMLVLFGATTLFIGLYVAHTQLSGIVKRFVSKIPAASFSLSQRQNRLRP